MIPHLPYPRRVQPVRPALAATAAPARPVPAPALGADLQTQFEALLDCVWKAEADWRFNDRLDMALKQKRDDPLAPPR